MIVGRQPPGQTAIRAVITDIDGTLTDRDRRIVPAAADLLHRLEVAGIPIVLATGNVLPIALAIHRSLGLSGPIVAENGGLVYSLRDGREHVERLADRRIALRAYRRLKSAGMPVRRLFTDRWRETEVALEPTVSVLEIRRHLRGIPVAIESTGFALHLIQQGRGKLPALHRALQPLGLAVSDCLVAGDGDNDVPMLKASAWGISFASASPRARKAADYVSASNSTDGFVEGLKASQLVLF